MLAGSAGDLGVLYVCQAECYEALPGVHTYFRTVFQCTVVQSLAAVLYTDLSVWLRSQVGFVAWGRAHLVVAGDVPVREGACYRYRSIQHAGGPPLPCLSCIDVLAAWRSGVMQARFVRACRS